MNQATALAVMKSGRNVFLTGSAGTGKTYVINQFIKHLQDAKVKVAVTASTGIAATHIKGSTIHSWSGIGIKQELSHTDLERLKKNKKFRETLQKTKVLIIDEISMLHKKQIEAIHEVLTFCNDAGMFSGKNAFGGLQVIVCGDFFQLPPVGQYGEQSRDKFAFMSGAWLKAEFQICYLTEQFRQNDNKLHTILQEMRAGQVTAQSEEWLKDCQYRSFAADVEPTKLFTHNEDVDFINNEHLAKLQSKSRFFKAQTKGESKLIEMLRNTVPAAFDMPLKIGAKVMFIKNNTDKGYINGTLGEIVDYADMGYPLVKTLDGSKIVASPEEWSIDDESGKPLAVYAQVPLRLAWAITVHKSQGMTLDAAELDLRKTFERGQGYVALSRLRTIETLKLTGYNQTALAVDRLAQKADVRFKQLSIELEYTLSMDELDEERKEFIRKSGGRVLKKL